MHIPIAMQTQVIPSSFLFTFPEVVGRGVGELTADDETDGFVTEDETLTLLVSIIVDIEVELNIYIYIWT